MSRLIARCLVWELLSLLVVLPSWGQRSGPSSIPRGPLGPGQPGPGEQTTQQVHYVTGRVLMDNGQPIGEPVSVELT